MINFVTAMSNDKEPKATVPQEREKCVLVGLVTPQQGETKSAEYLDELAFLADTAGAEAVCRMTQRLDYPNPRTFVGKGKLDEIRQYIEEDGDIAMAIFEIIRTS